jgi:hypothetical protein
MDDLAQYADEGRDKLRYAPASGMYALNRRFPNESSHCRPFEVGERRELKRLSTCRKRNQQRYR